MPTNKNPFERIETRLKRVFNVLPMAIGRLAVNHFRDSFDKQKFNDAGQQPWAEVERRKPDSDWYGFKLGAAGRRPRKKGGRKARKFKDGRKAKGHFSQARTTNAIMQVTGTLRDSIFVLTATGKLVVIASSHPGAALLNNGGQMKVFGKHSATMPKRQFMGPSKLLTAKLRKMIREELRKAVRG